VSFLRTNDYKLFDIKIKPKSPVLKTYSRVESKIKSMIAPK